MKRSEDLIPHKTVTTPYGELVFYCAGRIGLYRADTFHTKEPETLEWIDRIEGDAVLWDLGANVGTYALYAAQKPGVQVLAFEPSAFNYFVLMKNIDLNGLDGRVAAYCLAFSDRTALACLNMQYMEVGDSCHELVEGRAPERPQGVRLQHAVMSWSIDEFLRTFDAPFPTHLKIDTDGAEPRIVAGAARALSDPRLRSVLIELNEQTPKDMALVETLRGHGLQLVERRHAPQYEASPIYNYIFDR